MTNYHTPVLLHETLEGMHLQPGDSVMDGTMGGGGHTRAILEQVGSTGHVYGFDRDMDAINNATSWQAEYQDQLTVIHRNFAEAKAALSELGVTHVKAVVLDLGISWHHLAGSGRGFSYQALNEPLDMRMDVRETETAEHLVNTLSETALADLLYNFGEEPHARRIARQIVQHRPLHTVEDLVQCIKAAGGKYARSFQALRIAVNQELQKLPQAISDMVDLLDTDGRLAIITFHSLEDRLVKHTLRALAHKPDTIGDRLEGYTLPHIQEARIQLITKKPVIPTYQEVRSNPKARSAKLRVAVKI